MLHISNLKEVHLWVAGIGFFVLSKLVLADVTSKGIIVGLVLLGISLYWLIVPFLMGKTIYGLTNSADEHVEGEDDSSRFLFFVGGVFLFVCSLMTK